MQSVDLSLNVKLEQKLSLQLVQTVELLAMSAEELNEDIRKKAEENPLLRVTERPAVSYSVISDRFAKWNGKSESYTEDSGGEEGPDWIEGMVSRKESLQEHLLGQLGLLKINPDVSEAAATLITAMDRNGFFQVPPEDILKEDQRDCLSPALEVIRQLDPPGTGVRSWRESLIAQAEVKGVKGTELKILKGLVGSKLELVQSGKTEKAAKELGTDTAEIEALMDFIRTLTPFPGRNYSSDYENYIIPELAVKRNEEGTLCLYLADDLLPELSLDPEYEEMEEDLSKEKSKESRDARKFLREKRSEAKSLITQVDLRRTTLEKLGRYLMEKQRDFFLSGPLCLKALTMTQAAKDLGVNDSTISRLASAKYIDTDFGVLPIRELFSTPAGSGNGEDYSKNAVKELIRQMIEENQTGKKLTDQRISDLLAEKGIKVARRTVAKYRSELDTGQTFKRPK